MFKSKQGFVDLALFFLCVIASHHAAQAEDDVPVEKMTLQSQPSLSPVRSLLSENSMKEKIGGPEEASDLLDRAGSSSADQDASENKMVEDNPLKLRPFKPMKNLSGYLSGRSLLPTERKKQEIGALKPGKPKKDNVKIIQSLEDALCASYGRNTDLENSRVELKRSVSQISESLSEWRPDLSVVANVGGVNARDGQRGSNPKTFSSEGLPNQSLSTLRGTHNRDVGLQLRQNLFTSGRILSRVKKAKAIFLSAAWKLIAQEQKTLLQTIDAYMNLIFALEMLKMEELNRDGLQNLFEEAKSRCEHGEVPPREQELAAARLAESQQKVQEAQAEIRKREIALQRITGTPVDLRNLSMPLYYKKNVKTLEDLKRVAMKNHPAIRAAGYALSAGRFGVSEMVATFLPRIDLQAGASRGNNYEKERVRPSSLDNWSDRYTSRLNFGVTATVPLYGGGGRSFAQYRAAEQSLKENRLFLENARREAVEVAVQQFADFRASLINVEAARFSLVSYANALKAARSEYSLGITNAADLFQYISYWVDSYVKYLRTRVNLVKRSFEVTSAEGKLTARQMNLPVTYHDPMKYYNQYADSWFGLGDNEEENSLFEGDPLKRK